MVPDEHSVPDLPLLGRLGSIVTATILPECHEYVRSIPKRSYQRQNGITRTNVLVGSNVFHTFCETLAQFPSDLSRHAIRLLSLGWIEQLDS